MNIRGTPKRKNKLTFFDKKKKTHTKTLAGRRKWNGQTDKTDKKIKTSRQTDRQTNKRRSDRQIYCAWK